MVCIKRERLLFSATGFWHLEFHAIPSIEDPLVFELSIVILRLKFPFREKKKKKEKTKRAGKYIANSRNIYLFISADNPDVHLKPKYRCIQGSFHRNFSHVLSQCEKRQQYMNQKRLGYHPLFFHVHQYLPIYKNQQMGIISQEEDVLKLVHPGRHVEIRKEPITVAEVLKKNPRHSITRPDVFHYPWNVVKPEAVLKPGKVFLIVPNCTMYGLLKTYREHHQHSPRQRQLSKNVDHRVVQSRNSPGKSARMTPRPLNWQRWFKQSLCIGTTFEQQDSDKEIRAWKSAGKSVGMTPKHLNQQQPFKPLRPITSCIGTASQEHNLHKRIIKQAKNESWPKLVSMNKNPFLELEQKPEDYSTSEIRTSHLKERHFANTNISAEFPRKNDCELEFNCMEKVNTLKSCLRKPDSARKFLVLRVSFMLPVDDDEKQRAVNASRIEVTNNDSTGSSDFFCSFYKPRSYVN